LLLELWSMKEGEKDLILSHSIFRHRHGNIVNSSPYPHKLPGAGVCYGEVSLLLA